MRASAAANGLLHLIVAYLIAQVALGSSQEDTDQSGALSMPGGQFLVAIAAIVILAIGGYHIYSGATAKFLEDLDKNPPAPLTAAGRIGYIAKGIALLATGSPPTASTASPRRSTPRSSDLRYSAASAPTPKP